MCFPSDASPPIPEITGAEVDHRRLTLTAEDGNELMAFHTTGDGAHAAGVIVLPDVRGLFHFYEELGLRFAQHGYNSVAIDYFGRTAGSGSREDGFDFMPHVHQTTHEGIRSDVAAAAALLRDGEENRRLVTVGFCFGGSNSWQQAANGHGLAGAIGFYGHPNRDGFPIGSTPVIGRVTEMECPVLALMAGDDPGIPESEVDPFRRALEAADNGGEVVTYPGAPHSFFDRTYEQHADASADAWDRVLKFIANVT